MAVKVRSVTRRGHGMTVAPSPFNGVKLELGLLLVVGLGLWLVHEDLVSEPVWQLALLFGYGAGAALWLVLRTHRVSRAAVAELSVDRPRPRRGA